MTNRLYIGSRRYSSWSMRGWLAVKLAGLQVEETAIRLTGGSTPEVKRISPGGTVPVLLHDGNLIWDSLAIIEYCAELAPNLWPAGHAARAVARAGSAEMHSSYRDLRMAMPMCLGCSFPGQGRTEGALANIARIEQLWADARARFGGQFLFGDFGAADVMFAPVAARFAIYRPELSAASEAYCAAVLSHPLVAQWIADAANEPADWREDRYEAFMPTP
jgi:glutathione S-transferase